MLARVLTARAAGVSLAHRALAGAVVGGVRAPSSSAPLRTDSRRRPFPTLHPALRPLLQFAHAGPRLRGPCLSSRRIRLAQARISVHVRTYARVIRLAAWMC